MNKNTFSILNFFEFRSVKNQYSDLFIKNSKAVKIEETNDFVKIACSSETINELISVLKTVHAPKKIITETVEPKQFAEFIGNIVEKQDSFGLELNSELETNSKSKNFSLENVSSSSQAVNVINAICLEALRKRASDIHLQEENNFANVRFRIDGVLHTVKKIDKNLFRAVVSRLKIMASLNLLETRLLEDGRISVYLNEKKLDLRVSFVPVTFGQSVVIRIFNNSESLEKEMSLSELGFSPKNQKLLLSSIKNTNGLILVTGPTGSGKTTTLHALLQELDKEHLKIVTIEDPVERTILGVDHIQVNEELGLTFESILRRVLRQDPDVIMVGEIRDSETAFLALRAALTGHLVFSTLHTNSAFSAIDRLKNLGIEPYLIQSVLKLTVSQRLVRKVCAKSETGFYGRTVVCEIFPMSESIKELILLEKSEKELLVEAKKNGFISIKEDALEKVKEEITSVSELYREGILEN